MIRKQFLKKFTKSSLIIALIFAVNAFLLFFLEKRLQENLNQYEAQIAVKNSLFLEKNRVSIIEKELLKCKQSFPINCADYSAELIRHFNRLKDLIIVSCLTLHSENE